MSAPLLYTIDALRGSDEPLRPLTLQSGIRALPVVDVTRQPTSDELGDAHAAFGHTDAGAGLFPCLELVPATPTRPVVLEELRLVASTPFERVSALPGAVLVPALIEQMGLTPAEATAQRGVRGASLVGTLRLVPGVYEFGNGWILTSPFRLISVNAVPVGEEWGVFVRWREPVWMVQQAGTV